MKEFDNWWKDSPPSWRNLGFHRGIAMATWKAALEWALTQETDLQSTELGNAIDKELKDE